MTPAEASTPEERVKTGVLRAAQRYAMNGETRFLFRSTVTFYGAGVGVGTSGVEVGGSAVAVGSGLGSGVGGSAVGVANGDTLGSGTGGT